MSGPRHWAVVPAAGQGRRMGTPLAKQYLTLAGRRVIEHSLKVLLEEPRIAAVVVALAPGDLDFATLPPARDRRVLTAVGGAERHHSVAAGLARLRPLADDADWVLVHDAARPCLTVADLTRLMDRVGDDPVGGLLAVPVRDTMKRADSGGRVHATVDRAGLWHALTPQMFRFGTLMRALAGPAPTDEAQAVEWLGLAPRLVEGRADNIKITRADDLALAAAILAARES